MALRGLFRFQNPDSTKDLNDRFSGLVLKGVLDPGATHSSGAPAVTTPVVVRVPGQLAVDVISFMGVGTDGMVVVNDAPPNERLAVTAGITQYILVRSVYAAAGPADVAFEVRSNADWTAMLSSDKAKRLILAKITLGGGATEVLDTDIDLTENNIIDKFDRSFIRGVVDDASELPLDAGTIARVKEGDVYLAITERQFYRFNGTTWDTVTDGAVSDALTAHLNVLGPASSGTVSRDGDAYPAHPSLGISFDPTTTDLASTTVQEAIVEHVLQATDAHDASAISVTAISNIVATDVQAALAELEAEKVKVSGDTMTGELIITPATGTALAPTGANNGAGVGGRAILALGGNSTGADGAIGIAVVGGQSDVAEGGVGVLAQGGGGTSATGGTGLYGQGGSVSGGGGRGVFGQGGSPNGSGVVGTGSGTGNGIGVVGNGSGTAAGVHGVGGATSGSGVTGNGTGNGSTGVSGTGGGLFGTGVVGAGAGGGQGVLGVGQGVGQGVYGSGGATNGIGVEGGGGGTTGIGVSGTGGSAGTGVEGNGGATNGTGVVGNGGGSTGYGVVGNGGGASGVGIVGNGGSGSSGTGIIGTGGGSGADGVKGVSVSGKGVYGTVSNSSGQGGYFINTASGGSGTADGEALRAKGNMVWEGAHHISVTRKNSGVDADLTFSSSPDTYVSVPFAGTPTHQKGITITSNTNFVIARTALYLVSYNMSPYLATANSNNIGAKIIKSGGGVQDFPQSFSRTYMSEDSGAANTATGFQLAHTFYALFTAGDEIILQVVSHDGTNSAKIANGDSAGEERFATFQILQLSHLS